MLTEIIHIMLYGATFICLFVIDYLLGNGFINMIRRLFCTAVCSVRKSIREYNIATPSREVISLPILITELTFLGLAMAFLSKFKQSHGKDRLDELLQESRDAIQQTNEFIEKWRFRKINWQVSGEHSYLDEEPQEIKPLKLEVPILHMAIIDTLGSSRNQLERGDAGDSINITDSTILSMTSLLDDDLESIPPQEEEKIEEFNSIELNNRCLWDVIEEDSNFED